MALRFIGIDPETGQHGSPTVWVHERTRDLVIQGLKPDEELVASCAAFTVPGHAPGIPSHEAVIRVPARMVAIIREACDAAGRAGL